MYRPAGLMVTVILEVTRLTSHVKLKLKVCEYVTVVSWHRTVLMCIQCTFDVT